MEQFRKYKVYPNIPEKLAGINIIANNLWLSWNPEAVRLFVRMDQQLWDRVHHNPIRMLSEVSQERLLELSRDEGYVNELGQVVQRQSTYLDELKKSRYYKPDSVVVYLSAEFGLSEALPIYSGGLGILSGDHVKSASDLGLNLVAIGLFYRYGFAQQRLNEDGWQKDLSRPVDFRHLQVKEALDSKSQPLLLAVDLPGRQLQVKVWSVEVGRTRLYLLDTDVEPNSEPDRKITSQLYGGDREMRLKQEIVLGIGGIKLTERLELPVHAIHMNEGHSAFAAFERIAVIMRKFSLDFEEAFEISRKSTVFTTHTPVPAGNDSFAEDLIKNYFAAYVKYLDISIERFLDFGTTRDNPHQGEFSMTVAAIKGSAFVNGVSLLHGEVTRKMWRGIWPDAPVEHVPIQSVTNGVHLKSWLSMEMNTLFEHYLGKKWHDQQDADTLWEKVGRIPEAELWNTHEIRRRRLIQFVRRKLKRQLLEKNCPRQKTDEAMEVLNPDALTIGFARRFATYKRATLLLHDTPRLLKILNDPERPVQLIFAGKAHPQDHAGKTMIQKIVQFIENNRLFKKVVFIENYDINVARYLVQGVDVWLNNPVRPLEACGTSGMKAASNGVVNLSVLDGWWNEAYEAGVGWAIGRGESHHDHEYRNQVESGDIYNLLENEIVPLFYNRDSDGLPALWVEKMKQGFSQLSPVYNSQRMVRQYQQMYYERAADFYRRFLADDLAGLRRFSDWKSKLLKHFSSVSLDSLEYGNREELTVGDSFTIKVTLSTGPLTAADLAVDVYYGQEGEADQIKRSDLLRLQPLSENGGDSAVFNGDINCGESGNFAFKIRVTPSHEFIDNPYEMNLVKWF